MSGFKATKFGNWAGAMKLVSGLSGSIDNSLQKSLKQVGLKGESVVIKHIQAQDLGWKPLSIAYKRRKERQGYSNKILIRTSTLLQNIKSDVVSKSEVFVGVNRQVRDAEGNSVADIATIMEYGSIAKNIPARPLWRPTHKELMEWIKKENIFFKNLKKDVFNV